MLTKRLELKNPKPNPNKFLKELNELKLEIAQNKSKLNRFLANSILTRKLK